MFKYLLSAAAILALLQLWHPAILVGLLAYAVGLVETARKAKTLGTPSTKKDPCA